jgi:hypothetical protein
VSILFVCHSTDDANSLRATAMEMVKQSHENILFLAIGKPARTHLQQQTWFTDYPQIKVTSLAEIFNQEIMDVLEIGEFTDEQRDVMRQFYLREQVTRGLIGTSSHVLGSTAYQIAEDLVGSKLCNRVCIFHNYLYIESDSAYEKIISNNEALWCRQITWLLPIPQAREHLLQSSNIRPENVIVVGDPAAENYILAQISPSSASKKVREDYLKVLDQYPLLYVSGSKDSEADLKLLKGLMDELEKTENSGITVRIGIHPDLEGKNVNKYIEALLKWFDELSADEKKIKLVINDYILAKGVNPRLINHRTILNVGDLKTEQAAAAADSIATTAPSTPGLNVAVTGTPLLVATDDKLLAQVPHLYMGSSSMPLLFNETRLARPWLGRSCSQPLLRESIPADSAREVVAQVLRNRPL